MRSDMYDDSINSTDNKNQSGNRRNIIPPEIKKKKKKQNKPVVSISGNLSPNHDVFSEHNDGQTKLERKISLGSENKTADHVRESYNNRKIRQNGMDFVKPELGHTFSGSRSSVAMTDHKEKKATAHLTPYDDSKITLTEKEKFYFEKTAGKKLIENSGYNAQTGQMDKDAYGALRRAGGDRGFVEGTKLVESGDRSFSDLCSAANKHTVELTPREKSYVDSVIKEKPDLFENTGYDRSNGTISIDAYAGIRSAGGNFKDGIDLMKEGIISFRPYSEKENTYYGSSYQPQTLPLDLGYSPGYAFQSQDGSQEKQQTTSRILLTAQEKTTFERSVSADNSLYNKVHYDPGKGEIDAKAYAIIRSEGGTGGFSEGIAMFSKGRKNFDTASLSYNNDKVILSSTEKLIYESVATNDETLSAVDYDRKTGSMNYSAYTAIRNSGGEQGFKEGMRKISDGTIRLEMHQKWSLNEDISRTPYETGVSYELHDNGSRITLTQNEKNVFERFVSVGSDLYKKVHYDAEKGQMDTVAYGLIRSTAGNGNFTEGINRFTDGKWNFDTANDSYKENNVTLSSQEKSIYENAASSNNIFSKIDYDHKNGTLNLSVYAAIRNSGGEQGFREGIRKISEGAVKLEVYHPQSVFELPKISYETKSPYETYDSSSRITLTQSEKNTFEKYVTVDNSLYHKVHYDPAKGQMDTVAYGVFRLEGGKGGFSDGVNLFAEGKKDYDVVNASYNEEKIYLSDQEKSVYEKSASENDSFSKIDYDHRDGSINLSAYAAIRNSSNGRGFQEGVRRICAGTVEIEKHQMQPSFKEQSFPHEIRISYEIHDQGSKIILTPNEKRTFERLVSTENSLYNKVHYNPSKGQMDTVAYGVFRSTGGNRGFSEGVNQFVDGRKNFDEVSTLYKDDKIRLLPQEKFQLERVDSKNNIFPAIKYDNKEGYISLSSYAAIRNSGGKQGFTEGIRKINEGSVMLEMHVAPLLNESLKNDYSNSTVYRTENVYDTVQRITLTQSEKKAFEELVSKENSLYHQVHYNPVKGQMDASSYSILRQEGRNGGFAEGVNKLASSKYNFDTESTLSQSNRILLSPHEKSLFEQFALDNPVFAQAAYNRKDGSINSDSYAIIRNSGGTQGFSEGIRKVNNGSVKIEIHHPMPVPVLQTASYTNRTMYDIYEMSNRITLTQSEKAAFEHSISSVNPLYSKVNYDAAKGRMDTIAYGLLRHEGGKEGFVGGINNFIDGKRNFDEACAAFKNNKILLSSQEKTLFEQAASNSRFITKEVYNPENGTLDLGAYAAIRNAGGEQGFKEGLKEIDNGIIFDAKQSYFTILDFSQQQPEIAGSRIILSRREKDIFEKNIPSDSPLYRKFNYNPVTGEIDTSAYSVICQQGGARGFSGAFTRSASVLENIDLSKNDYDSRRIVLSPAEKYFFEKTNPDRSEYRYVDYNPEDGTIRREAYAIIRNAGGEQGFKAGIKKVEDGTVKIAAPISMPGLYAHLSMPQAVNKITTISDKNNSCLLSGNEITLTPREKLYFESKIKPDGFLARKLHYNQIEGKMPAEVYGAIRRIGGSKGFSDGVILLQSGKYTIEEALRTVNADTIRLTEKENIFFKLQGDSLIKNTGYDISNGIMSLQAYSEIRNAGGDKGFAEGVKRIEKGEVSLNLVINDVYEAPQMVDKRYPENNIFSKDNLNNFVVKTGDISASNDVKIFRSSWTEEERIRFNRDNDNILCLRMASDESDQILNNAQIMLNKSDMRVIGSDPRIQRALNITESGAMNAGMYARLMEIGGDAGFAGGIQLIKQGRLTFDNEKMNIAFLNVSVDADQGFYTFIMPSAIEDSSSIIGPDQSENVAVCVQFATSVNNINIVHGLSLEEKRTLFDRSTITLDHEEDKLFSAANLKIVEDKKAGLLSKIDYNASIKTINAGAYESLIKVIKNKGLNDRQKVDFISGRRIVVSRSMQTKLEKLGLSANELKLRFDYDIATKTIGKDGYEILALDNRVLKDNMIDSPIQIISNQDVMGKKVISYGIQKGRVRNSTGQIGVGEENFVRTVIAGGQRYGKAVRIGERNVSEKFIIKTGNGTNRHSDNIKLPSVNASDIVKKGNYINNNGSNIADGKSKNVLKFKMLYSQGKRIKIAAAEKRAIKIGLTVLIPYTIQKMNDRESVINPAEGVNTTYTTAMVSYELVGASLVRRAKKILDVPYKSEMNEMFAKYVAHLNNNLVRLGAEAVPTGMKGAELTTYASKMLQKLQNNKGAMDEATFKALSELYKELARFGRNDLETYLNHLNKILVANGAKAAPVSLRGFALEKFAQEQLAKIHFLGKGLSISEIKNIKAVYEELAKLGKYTTFRDVRTVSLFGKTRYIMATVIKQLEKYGGLAGEGLATVMNMFRYAKMAVRSTLMATQFSATVLRITAKLSMKAAILAATGVAKTAGHYTATSTLASNIAGAANTAINGLNKTSSATGKITGKIREKRDSIRSFRKDPFGLKTKAKNAFKKRIDKTWSKLTGRFKVLNKFNKFLQSGSKVAKAITKVFSTIAHVISVVINFMIYGILLLLALCILIAIIQAIVSLLFGGVMSLFDFMNSDEEVQQACIERLNELYSDDMSIMSDLSDDGYTINNVSYIMIKDDAEYTSRLEEAEKSAPSTTSNFAEILSMTLVRFDYDLDGTGFSKMFGTRKAKILDYVEGMYYASHNVNVTKWTESKWVDTDGDGETDKEVKNKYATVTYTTYYFNDLFNLEPSTKSAHYSTSNVEAVSYIPEYDASNMEGMEDAAYVYMRDAGFSANGASGAIAAIEVMTGFNPEQTDNGYGLGCWDTLGKAALNTYCVKNGFSSSSLEGQLRYLVYDILTNKASVAAIVRSDDITAKDAAQVVAIDYLGLEKDITEPESTAP